jgi:C4-dicarboxylate-specific signal transduction histidine kinase
MALMASSRTPVRRRQRSTRVTVAVSLLSAAAVAVLVSLPTQSSLWLSIASVSALALAVGALRVMWTEVLQSRRENAADRAAAAAAYRNLFSKRAAEHAEFTTAMTDRLAQAHLAAHELEGLVVQHETRAQRAESRLVTETEAHVETKERVQRLEQALVALQADGSVVDLVAWDEQVQKTGAKKKAARALKQA